MISSMAEECDKPTTKLPNALSLCVPIGGIAGLFFVSHILLIVLFLELVHTSFESSNFLLEFLFVDRSSRFAPHYLSWQTSSPRQ
jgi:amino acid transporter